MARSPNRLLPKLGARIRSLRRAQGLSQEQLAFEARIDRASISDIERGIHDIGVRRLAKIARALGVSLAALVNDL